jgi:hypothetical protein
MSGEPAVRKVLDRLKTWLDGNLGTGVTLLLDERDAQHAPDLPYVSIVCDRTTFRVFNYGSMLHEATIKFGIVTDEEGATNINEAQAEIAASIVARLSATTYAAGTLGELLQDKLPLSMGSEQDEFDLADAGGIFFTWSLTWLTPIDDFRTIIGAAGLVS